MSGPDDDPNPDPNDDLADIPTFDDDDEVVDELPDEPTDYSGPLPPKP